MHHTLKIYKYSFLVSEEKNGSKEKLGEFIATKVDEKNDSPIDKQQSRYW